MAATVAAPLERRLGEIAGVTEITSTSSLGSTNITIQFDLNRNIDGAARDVQAALNAALTDLPGDLPTLAEFPQGQSVGVADSDPGADLEDHAGERASTTPPTRVIAQRISQVDGVADVTVSGAEQPAIRVRVDPVAIAAMGIAIEDVRTAIATANAIGPLGIFDGGVEAETIATNDQLRACATTTHLVVKTIERRHGAARPTSPPSSGATATPAPPPGSTASRRCC